MSSEVSIVHSRVSTSFRLRAPLNQCRVRALSGRVISLSKARHGCRGSPPRSAAWGCDTLSCPDLRARGGRARRTWEADKASADQRNETGACEEKPPIDNVLIGLRAPETADCCIAQQRTSKKVLRGASGKRQRSRTDSLPRSGGSIDVFQRHKRPAMRREPGSKSASEKAMRGDKLNSKRQPRHATLDTSPFLPTLKYWTPLGPRLVSLSRHAKRGSNLFGDKEMTRRSTSRQDFGIFLSALAGSAEAMAHEATFK